MSDIAPRHPAGVPTVALFGLVAALMAVAVLYALAMVVRNWSHIGV